MRAACAARVPGFAADRERRVLLLLPITPGLEHRAGQIEQTVVEQYVARQFQALADEIERKGTAVREHTTAAAQ